MNRPKLHEEVIGVKLPGEVTQLATVWVGATDSDEQVLKGLSKVIGTEFNVTGTRYRLVNLNPFKLKLLSKPSSEDNNSLPPTTVAKEVEPIQKKTVEPSVGETWRTKDKRRSTTFKIASIDGDYAITEDSRRVQLARFCRYEKVA